MSQNVPAIKNLRPKQLGAVQLLAGGSRMTEVADTLGISRRQLQRWLYNNDAFERALFELQREIKRTSPCRYCVAQLQKPPGRVVCVMRKGTAKDRMSLAAAREILDRILGKPVPRTERVNRNCRSCWSK